MGAKTSTNTTHVYISSTGSRIWSSKLTHSPLFSQFTPHYDSIPKKVQTPKAERKKNGKNKAMEEANRMKH